MANILSTLIRFYQCWFRGIWSSGFFPLVRSECRFHPSCSEYCLEALTHHPFMRAVPLCARRILRCYAF